MVIRKLAGSNLRVHRARSLLTISAIMLSVSLVVSVTSGYASVEAMAYRFISRYMGSADAIITLKGDPNATFPETLVDELRADPDVKRVTGRLEVENILLDASGKAIEGHPAQVIGLRRPIDTRVETLEPTSGGWFNTPDGDVAVVDQVAAEKTGAPLGGTFTLPGPNGAIKLKVVGIVQKPQVLAAHIQSIYLPLETLQKFLNPKKPPAVNRVMVDLKPGVATDPFVARWQPKLFKTDKRLTMRLGRDIRQLLDNNLQGVHILSYLGGSVSMLAAAFIIFSALSMGVTERSRTLAMLRAIGAARSQVAMLVVVEGLFLSGIGVLIGTPLGWLWLYLLQLKFGKLLPGGIAISWGGVSFAAAGSLVAAMLASLLPAWWATRVRPLEAMSPSATPSSRWIPLICGVFGLLLISCDPLLLFSPIDRLFQASPESEQTVKMIRFYGHFFVGLPTLMVGFFLLAPSFVIVLERVAGPVVAVILRMQYTLLRQQLSSGVWRAAGTCAALMVGLAILIAMETEGNSMLKGWQLPDKFPDIFIVSWGTGLDDAQIEKLSHLKGIKPGEVLPVALASPEFGGTSLFALGTAAIVPDATMFFGIDPDLGMKMMKLDFREGTSDEAARLVRGGDHIIVTDEFKQLKHLGVGGIVPLKTDLGTVNFKIAGVVWSPGMDLINSKFDMGRQFDQRTGASIFGSMSDAKKYFGATRNGIRLFAANLDASSDKDTVLAEVQKQLNVQGMQAGDVRQIKQGMKETFGDLLLLVALVPFGAMLVASLGVTNTIMASIRTRRWQLGVLRSIGLTQSQLLRLIFSEAAMVGVVGAGMGIAAGALLATDAHELSRIVTGFHPSISVPWGIIAIGTGVVMLIAIVAGAWPAITVAKTEPLTLLQGGRATA